MGSDFYHAHADYPRYDHKWTKDDLRVGDVIKCFDFQMAGYETQWNTFEEDHPRYGRIRVTDLVSLKDRLVMGTHKYSYTLKAVGIDDPDLCIKKDCTIDTCANDPSLGTAQWVVVRRWHANGYGVHYRARRLSGLDQNLDFGIGSLSTAVDRSAIYVVRHDEQAAKMYKAKR